MKLKAQISPPEPRCGYRINREAALLWTRRVLERLQAVQNQQGSTGRLPWHNEANGSSVLIGDRLTVNPAGKQSEFVPGLVQVRCGKAYGFRPMKNRCLTNPPSRYLRTTADADAIRCQDPITDSKPGSAESNPSASPCDLELVFD